MNIRDFVEENYDQLLLLLNCIKVGIWVTDNKGRVILLNDQSAKTGGMSREEVLGKTMGELIEMGYIYDSSVLRALKSMHEESLVQELGEGGHLYATGVPLMENGRAGLVVCTERDITETINLRELLKQQEQLSEKYESELLYLRRQDISKNGMVITVNPAMQHILATAIRVAKLDTTVMLTGESGTGKELIANLIYENSQREGKPFIKVNCAAIPENLLESEFFGYEKGAFTGANKEGKIGFFELADKGTLFLDEIGELPIQMQSKLLRVLQEKEIIRIGGSAVIPIDVRILSATNIDLWDAIKKGKFREDLYYRLNIIPIEIPPLRERKEDIRRLTNYFVELFNKEYNMDKMIAEEAMKELEAHYWPGNIRELRNIIERTMVSSDKCYIEGFDVLTQLSGGSTAEEHKLIHAGKDRSLEEIVNEFEKELLVNYMERYGSANHVAVELKVNKSTISRKLKKYGIPLKG